MEDQSIEPKKKNTPKKRGRKPVGKVKQVQNMSNIKNDNDCIIAHIPIKLTTELAQECVVDGPQNISITTPSLDVVNENNIDIDTDSVHSDDSDMQTDIFITGNISCLTENEILQEKKIIELKNTIKLLNHKLINKNTEKQRQVFKNTAMVNIAREHTKTLPSRCWHCVHEFEGDAIGLPEKYYKKEFHVFGIFCSFNCALKYNQELDDIKMWDRTSWLHMMYNQYYETTHTQDGNEIQAHKIQPAPPRVQLDIFGGPFTIEQFRNISTNNKSYRTILPPMVPITPLIEEDYRLKCNIKVKSASDNIPIDMKNISNINRSLKLKREKPLITSQFSLEKTMGIKRKPQII